MRKLLAAVMMFAGAAAYAQVDATEVGPAIRDEARDVKDSAKMNAKEWGEQAGLATQDEGTFKTAQAFDLKGKLKDGGRGEITVLRDNLPPAVLDMRDATAVFVDGKKCKPADLKAGMNVKAKFQIEGEETVAVRVDGYTRGYGGSGKAGTTDAAVKDDMNRAGDKADATADKAAKKTDKSVKKADKKMDHAADDVKDEAHDATH